MQTLTKKKLYNYHRTSTACKRYSIYTFIIQELHSPKQKMKKSSICWFKMWSQGMPSFNFLLLPMQMKLYQVNFHFNFSLPTLCKLLDWFLHFPANESYTQNFAAFQICYYYVDIISNYIFLFYASSLCSLVPTYNYTLTKTQRR